VSNRTTTLGPNLVGTSSVPVSARGERPTLSRQDFADKEAVKRWYNSPEYQKILPMRLDNSTGRAFVVEGVS
jgi:uncharacterized protein (DUF1330 family)